MLLLSGAFLKYYSRGGRYTMILLVITFRSVFDSVRCYADLHGNPAFLHGTRIRAIRQRRCHIYLESVATFSRFVIVSSFLLFFAGKARRRYLSSWHSFPGLFCPICKREEGGGQSLTWEFRFIIALKQEETNLIVMKTEMLPLAWKRKCTGNSFWKYRVQNKQHHLVTTTLGRVLIQPWDLVAGR